MNGKHTHPDSVYVVGYKFSGIELVQATVDKLLAAQQAHTPPGLRNGDTTMESTCLINQLPTSQFQEYMTVSGTKVVFVIRNPKDVAVAMHKNSGLETVIPFSDALDRFFTENSEDGSWFQHTQQWLEVLSSAKPSQVHIIYFDSFVQALEEVVKNLCVFLDVQLSNDRGLALCTQMTQETEQPQRKRQRTNSNTDGHKDNCYEVGQWRNYFTVTHNESFRLMFSRINSKLKLLDLNRLLS